MRRLGGGGGEEEREGCGLRMRSWSADVLKFKLSCQTPTVVPQETKNHSSSVELSDFKLQVAASTARPISTTS